MVFRIPAWTGSRLRAHNFVVPDSTHGQTACKVPVYAPVEPLTGDRGKELGPRDAIQGINSF